MEDIKSPLRIGILADTHDEEYGLMRRAVSLMGPIDYLVHLGDFLNNYEDESARKLCVPYKTAARRFGEIKQEFGIERVSAIPGNHDVEHPEDGLCELEKFSIHKKLVQVGGYSFLGYGGGYNFVQSGGWEKHDSKRFRNDSKVLEALLEEHNPDILFLHQLDSETESLRPVIEANPPKIVLSGHTHKHGIDFYERPIYASCGPILPLDEREHKQIGKSSFGVLTIEENLAKIKLYFFGKKVGEGISELDRGITINFNNY